MEEVLERALKRKVLIGITFVVAGALLSLVTSVRQVSAEPLRIGVFPNLHSALIYLADSEGFFKKHGVDVVIKVYESGPAQIADLVGDKIDIAIPAEFAFVLQAFTHPELRIAATICDGSDHDLLVRKDRGIGQPQDLKGKSVAVTRGSSGEFFLYNYLIFNRIPAGSVHVVYRTPSEIVKAMADGTIDAALSWPPYTTADGETTGRERSRAGPRRAGRSTIWCSSQRKGF